MTYDRESKECFLLQTPIPLRLLDAVFRQNFLFWKKIENRDAYASSLWQFLPTVVSRYLNLVQTLEINLIENFVTSILKKYMCMLC